MKVSHLAVNVVCDVCVYAFDMCAYYVCMFNYVLTINVLEGIRQTQDVL